MVDFPTTELRDVLSANKDEPVAMIRHVAHELRLPLKTVESIAHYLQLVLPRTEAKARRQLGRLQDEVHYMNWILADAIHLMGAPQPAASLLDLTEIVARTLSEWSPLDGASVSFSLEPALPLALLDVGQVEHLLRSIIALFRRASPPDGSISVSTFASDARVFLRISSNTMRMRLKEICALFEPVGPELPPGSGLGLASARRIAEAHGGSVTAESDGTDGVTITVVFPQAARS